MHSNILQIFAYIYLRRPGADKLPQATEIRPGPAPQPEGVLGFDSTAPCPALFLFLSLFLSFLLFFCS